MGFRPARSPITSPNTQPVSTEDLHDVLFLVAALIKPAVRYFHFVLIIQPFRSQRITEAIAGFEGGSP